MPDARHGFRARLGIILLLIATLVALPSAAAIGLSADAAPRDEGTLDPLRPPNGAYFGAAIDWSVDTAPIHAERLGRPPAILEHVTRFPASDQERLYLDQFLAQTAEVGAIPMITVEPMGGLEGFSRSDAAALADLVDEALGARPGASARVPASLRFAPQMNTPWVALGAGSRGVRRRLPAGRRGPG